MPKEGRPNKEEASGNLDRRAILRTTGTALAAGVAGLAWPRRSRLPAPMRHLGIALCWVQTTTPVRRRPR